MLDDEDEGIVGIGSVSADGKISNDTGCEIEHAPSKFPGKYVVRTLPGASVQVQVKHPDARVQSVERVSEDTHVVRIVAARSPSEPFNSPLEIAVFR